MKMYRFFASLLLLLCVLASGAQEKNKNGFSTEKFRAEIEQFITKEACLTPKEASKFFPVYDEMNRKKRNIFDNMRKLSKRKPADDAGCREVIRKCDKMDLELKKIQQTYHEKFLSIIPASKLFDVIKAEEKFHRRMLNRGRVAAGKERQSHDAHKKPLANHRGNRK